MRLLLFVGHARSIQDLCLVHYCDQSSAISFGNVCSLEMVKNDICLADTGKQNAILLKKYVKPIINKLFMRLLHNISEEEKV